jgi:Tfp pilus assembly protein PilE
MMCKVRKNEAGFSPVEIVMVLVIVALLGAVGFLVYKNQHKTTTASVTTATATKQPATKTPLASTDQYAGWKSYTLKYEKLTFKYPAGWTLKDDSASQGLTPNADSVSLTASNGFSASINTGWDGGGDSLNLATDSPLPVQYLGGSGYLVFSHPRCFGPDSCDANALKGAILMTNPSSEYRQNRTGGFFPQDKYAHGDPSVNNGGSTMLISAGYSGTNAKTFATLDQAKGDPEISNTVLFVKSMHY